MKLLWTSFLVFGAALVAAEPGATLDARQKPAADNPNLPRVMIIGDSISVGYTDGVREELAGKANVYRVQGNAGPSSSGVQQVDKWIASGTGRWDVIHFNFGLHDVKLGTGGKDNRPYPTADGRQVPVDDYERNLREIVAKLKRTGATLVWGLTTPIPQGKLNPPRRPGDEITYNEIAQKVMVENGVVINDLHAAALSQQPGIQQPANVHFTKEGSAVLAKHVAASIKAVLQNRAH
jgi:acyl-CoA thioesterase-1